MMNGIAGIPATKPGRVYHGLERAAGTGNDIPLITRHRNAMRFVKLGTKKYVERRLRKGASRADILRELEAMADASEITARSGVEAGRT
jgi:hypothetical protein